MRGTEKLGQDGNRCSVIDHISIPHNNISQSIKDSWLVSFSVHMPTKKKLLTPSVGGTERDRHWCSEIEDITIQYSKFSQSIKDSWVVSFSTHVPTKNAKSLTPSFGGTTNSGDKRIDAAR